MKENRFFHVDRGRLAWGLLALVFAVIVGYVFYSFIGAFVFGLFVYYATRPIYRRLTRRTHHRGAAAAGSLVGFVLPVLILLGYTVTIGIHDFLRLEVQGLSRYQELLRSYLPKSLQPETHEGISGILATLIHNPEHVLESGIGGTGVLRELVHPAVEAFDAIAHGLLTLVIVFVFAFYLLRDDRRLASWVTSRVLEEESIIATYVQAVDRDLQTVYFGNIVTAVVIGALATGTYTVLAMFAPLGLTVPSPILIGLLTGVASLIPVIGMKLVYVPVTVVLVGEAMLTNSALLWYPVAFVVVSIVVFDTVFEFVLRPYISGRNLHTGLVVFAYVLGAVLFGWYGLFLGPLLLVALVHFAQLILPGLVRNEPITPTAATTTTPAPVETEEHETRAPDEPDPADGGV